MSELAAVLSPGAFVAIATSAVEVYKRECLGLLLGRRRGDTFEVLHALPYQGAERGHHGVAVKAAIEERVLSVVRTLPGVELLGDYHSHPQFGGARGVERPSHDDTCGLTPGQIALIVAINEASPGPERATAPRRRGFRTRADGSLSGVLGGYDLRLAGIGLEGEDVVPVALRCPYAVELRASGGPRPSVRPRSRTAAASPRSRARRRP